VFSANVCVECGDIMCVLFVVLNATVWCVYGSMCSVGPYGVSTVRCAQCDCMVCVLFGVLSATVWCVTVRCVECEYTVCVLFVVLNATVRCMICSV